VGRPIKTAKNPTVDTGFDNPSGYGVVGGDTSLSVAQIECLVKIGTNPESVGSIVRQKGASKYLVTDGTNQGICSLSDEVPGALSDGAMTVTITKLDTTTARLKNFTNHFGYDFTNTGYYLTFNAAAAIPAGGIFEVAQVASA
jgi:hypothetical protein